MPDFNSFPNSVLEDMVNSNQTPQYGKIHMAGDQEPQSRFPSRRWLSFAEKRLASGESQTDPDDAGSLGVDESA